MQRRRIQIVEAWSDPNGLSSCALALMHLRLGEKEKAFVWLERAYQSHAGDLIYLNVEPQYDPIRNDPRFQDLVSRVGLPAPPAKATSQPEKAAR